MRLTRIIKSQHRNNETIIKTQDRNNETHKTAKELKLNGVCYFIAFNVL